MEYIGRYFDRDIYWLDYTRFADNLPSDNWICLAVADSKPGVELFETFVRAAIENGIVEFKGHGLFGEFLHDYFDEVVVERTIIENLPDMDVMTTWHGKKSLADTFWQSFHATALRDEVTGLD